MAEVTPYKCPFCNDLFTEFGFRAHPCPVRTHVLPDGSFYYFVPMPKPNNPDAMRAYRNGA